MQLKTKRVEWQSPTDEHQKNSRSAQETDDPLYAARRNFYKHDPV
jgi:hypothetical protein